MVLGKLPVPRRPTILITVGQGPIALAVGAGGGSLDILFSSILSPLSPSLWETARYRLQYCLKGPLNPKQPTKHLDLQSNWKLKRMFFRLKLEYRNKFNNLSLALLQALTSRLPVFSNVLL